MHKGVIVLVPFPFTDLSGNKIRPALILAASRRRDDCIVAFITSISKKRSSFEIAIRSSEINGLKVDSIVKIDKLATLEKKTSFGTIGKLEPVFLAEIDKKLKNLFRL